MLDSTVKVAKMLLRVGLKQLLLCVTCSAHFGDAFIPPLRENPLNYYDTYSTLNSQKSYTRLS